MKNEDILLIKKMIKYCDDSGTLMTKFDMEIIVWNTLLEDIPVLKKSLDELFLG